MTEENDKPNPWCELPDQKRIERIMPCAPVGFGLPITQRVDLYAELIVMNAGIAMLCFEMTEAIKKQDPDRHLFGLRLMMKLQEMEKYIAQIFLDAK